MTAYTYKLDQKGIPYRVPSAGIYGAGSQAGTELLQAGCRRPGPKILQHSGKQQAFQLYVFEM